VIEHYSAAWHAREVLLIGYSFGADVLPFIVNRLSDELQRRIRAVSLLGPSRLASFEVRVADWLPGRALGGSSIAAEIARMPGVPVLCLYGEGESDALCPQLPAERVKIGTVGKGHHFGGDYDAIAASVLAFSSGTQAVSSAIHGRQSEMILKAARPSI
jgi:type IV secretory pathway VirJ component